MKLFLLLNILITLFAVGAVICAEADVPDERSNFWYKLHFGFGAFLWSIMALVKYTVTMSLSTGVIVLTILTGVMWLSNMIYHDAKDKDDENVSWFLQACWVLPGQFIFLSNSTSRRHEQWNLL